MKERHAPNTIFSSVDQLTPADDPFDRSPRAEPNTRLFLTNFACTTVRKLFCQKRTVDRECLVEPIARPVRTIAWCNDTFTVRVEQSLLCYYSVVMRSPQCTRMTHADQRYFSELSSHANLRDDIIIPSEVYPARYIRGSVQECHVLMKFLSFD